MVKVVILMGVAASKRKFVAGQTSEFCLYLRVDGREVSEVTSFRSYQQIMSSVVEDLWAYAQSVQKQVADFVRYNYARGFNPNECEFQILNGRRNDLETGEDVRCQALPIEAIDALRDALMCHGFKEAGK